jgi:hypothetical protein
MTEKLEGLIRSVYARWKNAKASSGEAHPDEELLVCFAEGALSNPEAETVRGHILECNYCSLVLAKALQVRDIQVHEMPDGLLEKVKSSLIPVEAKEALLEIVLKLKEQALEIISTSGDVLFGQEFIPAPILRSRSIRDFKDEVTILRDFKDIRVEVKVENKGKGTFNVSILVKQKQTQRVLKDLRVTLVKDDIELESYLVEMGMAKFEHVQLGTYRVDISALEGVCASVLLDIKA